MYSALKINGIRYWILIAMKDLITSIPINETREVFICLQFLNPFNSLTQKRHQRDTFLPVNENLE